MKKEKPVYETHSGDVMTREKRMKGLKKGVLSKVLNKFKK